MALASITRSKVSSSRCSRESAASRSVEPCLCACLAMAAALSYPMTGLSAVTSIRLCETCDAMIASLGSVPTRQYWQKRCIPSVSSSVALSRLAAMSGLYTFICRKPAPHAMVTAASRPMTCTARMESASHWVGLTLPGMIDEPGSLAGRASSPSPVRGPEPSKRTSSAMRIRTTASRFSALMACSSASWPPIRQNLLSAMRNGSPLSLASSAHTHASYPAGALRPVPTAVPPRGRE
mmetsp:Transcript_26351/g.85098  ORF Transcript_26351/g.85098 Transcript_26351/m.85098 type:complete len:237 (+) Transcript_26351:453-1163(+)